MKRVLIIAVAAALAATTASAEWVYEGQWGSRGSGPGQLYSPVDVAVAPNGNVYVAEFHNFRIQYFTATGSFLGMWYVGNKVTPIGVAVAPNGNVYVVGSGKGCVQYFTSNGSFLGIWGSSGSGNGQFSSPWGKLGNGPGEFSLPHGIAVAPWGNVYVADNWNTGVQYFTRNGSCLGRWGEHWRPVGALRVAISADGTGFAVDSWNHRIRYCTTSGSLIGEWGTRGSGNGEFDKPHSVAVSPTGSRVYVADKRNYRIQYFNRNEPAVSPTSLGRVKALFR
ncbi:MAG: hypothetical protein V3T41_08160 [bacterium]